MTFRTCRCGAPLTQRKREHDSLFEVQRFCSLTCYHSSRTTEHTNRTCEVCAKTFTRHEDERPARFVERRTCGVECARALRATERSDAKSLDVLGVRLTRVEVAELVGIGITGVHARAQEGRNPLTGRKAS